MIYYEINEMAARRATDMNSFYEYRPGSATAEYHQSVDKAARLAQRQKYIQGLLEKIRSTGTGGISADNPKAVTELETKLAKREELQDFMKSVNTYYRKHGTLDGCPDLSAEQVERTKAGVSRD